MKFDTKGKRKESNPFNDFVDYITTQSHSGWSYNGMAVELDPTVDYNAQNILFRWHELSEGFNDRIMVNSIEEFAIHFTPNRTFKNDK